MARSGGLAALATPRPVGPRALVREVFRLPRTPLDFRFHVFAARIPSSVDRCLRESLDRYVASGISEDPLAARAATYGEAMERFAFVRAEQAVRSRAPEKLDAAFSPDMLLELPFLVQKPTRREEWAEQATGSMWYTMDATVVGGAAVAPRRLPAVSTTGPEASLLQTTNGFACSVTLDDAIERAVCELVERDALMLAWLYRSPGVRCPPAELLRPAYCEEIERMAHLGVRIGLRDISSGLGPHVFLAWAKGTLPRQNAVERRPIAAFGAGAHMNRRAAAEHAFREACLSWRGTLWYILDPDPDLAGREPDNLAQHGGYYTNWGEFDKLGFLLDEEGGTAAAPGGRPRPDASILDAMAGGSAAALRSGGYEVYAIDWTPPEVEEQGLRVVQAIVPRLVPLYVGLLRADDLARRRLPVTIGGIPVAPRDELNPDWHPWP